MKRILLMPVFILLMSVCGISQDYSLNQQYQPGDRPAQYILGSQDVLLITINLWGHVQRPGIYSIPSSFGLIDLLSSAGGPLKSARLNDVRVIRKNQDVIQVNVKEFMNTGNKDLLVHLQPGDLVIVSGSALDIFATIVGIVRDIAIIVNVIVLTRAIR
ncbi:MAG: SLBB domain-containing protein [Calditrichia bacterium]|nr:SLBB domain-containing protein [Calditrichia bacterium]